MKDVKTYVVPVPSGAEIEKQLNGMLEALPSWRREKALSYRNAIDRYLCAEAYLLLREGLKKDFGIDEEVKFAYTEFQKPYLRRHADIHFNISHCNAAVACAIARFPVGIDVEVIQFDDALATAILDPDEYSEVMKVEESDRAVCFTKAWTRKESYLKMIGSGITDDMEDMDIEDAEFESVVDRTTGYALTVCKRKDDE